MLNGKELLNKAIITGPIGEENIQQHGIDLNVIEIRRGYSQNDAALFKSKDNPSAIFDASRIGYIPVEGKAIVRPRKVVNPIETGDRKSDNYPGVWRLDPGYYEIIFAQGCSIPNDQMLLIRQRSSLLRNGTMIHSSVWDAGFKTKNMGCFMLVTEPIEIEVGARICQVYNHACTPVEDCDLYDGQYQNDKQRNNEAGK